ncbi:substrate-binding domain-containing protein [Curtobacterium flaccumfaciens]|nr:substrate-binding domain-containing protein [Curtobacterium flaccumfaciens]
MPAHRLRQRAAGPAAGAPTSRRRAPGDRRAPRRRARRRRRRDIDPPGGTDAGARIARMPADGRPDGVLGVTDLLAMAVVTELRAAGVRVPEDIPVSGCDHNSVAWGGAVPLTSVTMHGTDMGAAAVGLLLDELQDPPGTTCTGRS